MGLFSPWPDHGPVQYWSMPGHWDLRKVCRRRSLPIPPIHHTTLSAPLSPDGWIAAAATDVGSEHPKPAARHPFEVKLQLWRKDVENRCSWSLGWTLSTYIYISSYYARGEIPSAGKGFTSVRGRKFRIAYLFIVFQSQIRQALCVRPTNYQQVSPPRSNQPAQ